MAEWIPYIAMTTLVAFFGSRFIQSLFNVRKTRRLRKINVQLLAVENGVSYEHQNWEFEKRMRSLNLGYKRWTELLNLISFEQSGCTVTLLDYEVRAKNSLNVSEFRTGLVIEFLLGKQSASSDQAIQDCFTLSPLTAVAVYQDENYISVFFEELYTANQNTLEALKREASRVINLINEPENEIDMLKLKEQQKSD